MGIISDTRVFLRLRLHFGSSWCPLKSRPEKARSEQMFSSSCPGSRHGRAVTSESCQNQTHAPHK